MKKLSDFVMDFIADQGVHDVFMLPGGGCMHLVDSLGSNTRLGFICNLHEQASAIAAEAYGQYTNNLGVALVTTGPGGTNTITGVAGAWLDSTPCLFISGQVKRSDCVGDRGIRQMGFQEINIVRLVSSITKYAVMVTDPSTIRYHLEKAVFLARSGRPGPVWIDIPLDIQASMIDEQKLSGFDSSEFAASADQRPLQQQVSETISILNQSERPVILAGNGIRLAHAKDVFLQLADLLKIPILTTWKAIDFMAESHRLYCGRPGSIGQRGANFTQQNADCLLSIGARLDFGQTGYTHKNFARAARKIMVDIDPAEIDKMMTTIDVPVPADAKAFLLELLRQSGSLKTRDRSAWLTRCKDWQTKYPVVLPEYRSEQGFVNQYLLIDALSEEMTGDDLLVPGSSGAASEVSMQAFRVKEGMRIFNTEGLGSMGFGVPAAIGGCIASGRKRTVCVDGDGGFQMNIQELEVVKRLNLPIKLFILNNAGYGSIRTSQRNYFNGHYVASNPQSGLTLPDICKTAEAYGVKSYRLKDHANLRERINEILAFDGPAVTEVMVSPDQFTAPKLSSYAKPDGTMVSRPLEDLWPFLDREEFERNMIVPPLKED
jgi:acetolactate synthase I/II/III large subunit